MSMCVTRMNENVRAILERDHVDCEQKRLTGYLRKNKSLFQNKLPLLRSQCCCRHLQEDMRFDPFTNSLPRTDRDISIGYRNSLDWHGDKCPSTTGPDSWISSVESSYGKSRRLKARSPGSKITETTKHPNSGVKVNKYNFGKKLPSQIVVNTNETRIPIVLTTTSACTNNEKCTNFYAQMETNLKKVLQPLSERLETRFGEQQRQAVSAGDTSSQSASQILVCCSNSVSDKSCSAKERFATHKTYNSVFCSERNYSNVTPNDLINFNSVRMTAINSD